MFGPGSGLPLAQSADDVRIARRDIWSSCPLVSLKSNQVNYALVLAGLRESPGFRQQAGLPVEVFQESDNWGAHRDARKFVGVPHF